MNAEEKSIETLRKIKKIFDKHNIEYWLDEGTLLGAVREKKFIEWDHDIDIGVWVTTIPIIIPFFDELRKEGIEVCFHEIKKHIKLLTKQSEIDINPYHLNNNQAVRTWYEHNKFGEFLDFLILSLNNSVNFNESKAPPNLTKVLVDFGKIIPKWKKRLLSKMIFTIYEKIGCELVRMEIPAHFFKNFEELKFYNMVFKVPNKKEKYLEYKYGEGWKTPKRDYIYTRDDRSIVRK